MKYLTSSEFPGTSDSMEVVKFVSQTTDGFIEDTALKLNYLEVVLTLHIV